MSFAPAAASCPETTDADWRAPSCNASDAIDENRLIEENLHLVRSVVDRMKAGLPAHIDADDLYSVGVTGLIAAASRFDPAQGCTFSSYASLRIRGAILDELRRMDWCPRRARARARKLRTATNDVEQKVGRAATDEEVRTQLGLTRKDYAKWVESSRPVIFMAIDQRNDGIDGEGASMHELLADESDVTGRESMEKRELVELLTSRLAELPEMPKKILAMYYFERMRLAEIAEVFGLTESRICQIHSQTIQGLRSYLGRARMR
ncbi:MAG TPA: FliA/WhiG family RNA polymerase sigma factor [Opitutus sp.]|nr:FliA/WhiG family RNA polymerase sigma factor [Opitutus sp.]